MSGILKIEENLSDGLISIKGMIISNVLKLFNQEEIANYIMKQTKEAIAVDRVEELNKKFYEETEIGKMINSSSYLKYNSQVANIIKDTTTKVGEYAIATTITQATGGVLSLPTISLLLGTGAVIGIGKSSEDIYKEDLNNDYTNLILLDGLAGGLEMLGDGIGYLTLRKILMNTTGIKALLTNFISNTNNNIILNPGNILGASSVVINNITDISNNKSPLITDLFLDCAGGIVLDSFANLLI